MFQKKAITKVFLFGVFLVLALFSFIAVHYIRAQAAEYKLVGWLWSDTYGWISLSSDNMGGTVDYGLSVDSNNVLTGYGWSSNVGWVCFGDTCNSIPCLGAPPGESSAYVSIAGDGKATGWANVISLCQDGWIKIGRGPGATSAAGAACYDCQPQCETFIDPDGPDGSEPPYCAVYSDNLFDSCSTCFTNTKFDSQDVPAGQEAVVGGSGYICSNCTGHCQKIDSVGGGAYRVACDSCSTCEQYGVNLDFNSSGILGWAWGAADNHTGPGWVHFNTISNAAIVFPWLETQYGAIYTSQQVRQKAQIAGAKNATYCIFADSVERVSSATCDNPIMSVYLGFPTVGSLGIYTNALGKIDVNGLMTKVDDTHNKYGQVVNVIPGSVIYGNKLLGGQIYKSTGNLLVQNGLNFQNGGAGEKGAGTYIILGDLIINSDINYTGALPDDLKQLASVVWLVKGDIIVSGDPTNLVGAYVALGNGNDCVTVPGSDPLYPEYEQNGCGVFFSGQSANPLTVSGLIMAKAFDFRRTYANATQGSERIIYDGRLTANPPPGLMGFTEGLPVVRDFLYQ